MTTNVKGTPIVKGLGFDSFGLGANACTVDIDEEQELATQYGIESIPTVILFKDGKPINVEVGAHQKDFYANLIDMHL